jgi:trehalose synthase
LGAGSEQRDTEGSEESEQAEKEHRSAKTDWFVGPPFRNVPVPQRVPLRGLRLVRALRVTLLPFLYPWKDPVGVLEVYRHARGEHPGLQLVYMAGMAADDPEGWGLYEETRQAAGDDPDVHLLALDVPPDRVNRNALEVNAMQRGATVVLQKSIREGFGLVVTEALWKEKAVVAGNVGGIRLQIRDGWNGYLVDTVEEAATRTIELLADPEKRAVFGRNGRDLVTGRYLFTRLLGQYLGWFTQLTGP